MLIEIVDDVRKSGLLNVIGLFSRDVIGWKTLVEFVNSHWSVSIRLLFGYPRVSPITSFAQEAFRP